MRRIRALSWPPLHGATALSVLLVATLLAPLPGWLWGASLPTVFALHPGALLAAATTLGAAHVWWRWRRAGPPGAVGAAIVVAGTAALSAVLATIIERRASGFYTEDALYEGVVALLVLHVVAGTMRRVGTRRVVAPVRATRHGLGRVLRMRAGALPVTARAFADFVTDGVALLVAAFWILTALNARDVAFALMLVAGVGQVLVLVLRIPDAARSVPRRRMSMVTLVALGALHGCVAPVGSAGGRARRLVSDPAGPGCLGQDVHTAPAARPARAPVPPAHRLATSESGTLTLRLNIPAYRLDVLVDSTVVTSHGVAVGMRRHRTPTGRFAVHRIVWNPWWVPPRSAWARKDTVTPPGPANPMGRVKLLMGGPYYLHGTPFATSIGSAASHGCIRMRNEDAIALARRLQARAGAGPDDDELLYLLTDTTSTAVDLPQPVPLEIAYRVAELRRDTLLLHPDVYGQLAGRLRDAAMRAMADGGRDTTHVRLQVLAAAVRRARTRHVSIPLDSLLAGRTPDTSILVRAP